MPDLGLPAALDSLMLFLAAVLGGSLNAVAGGGSFFTFPALVGSGLGEVAANATSTVALWPGSIGSALAFRSDMAGLRRFLLPLGTVSALGGALGAWLLLHTSDAEFARLVPWLLGVATTLFAASPYLVPWLRRRAGGQLASLPALTAVQLLIAIYGGYFGGGMGILMLAGFAVLGLTDLKAANGLKALLGTLINGVAVVTFALSGLVQWPQALLMAVGGGLGGYYGARAARQVDPKWLRRLVVATGSSLTLWYALQS